MMYRFKKSSKARRKLLAKPLPICLAVLALLLVGFIALEFSGTTHVFRKEPVKTAVIPVTETAADQRTDEKDDASQSETASPAPNPLPQEDKDKTPTATPAPTGKAPDTPSGTFISNHNPNLDGDPYPSSVQSVCITTPGAKCYIVLTKSDLTRTLPEQTTNNDGFTAWTWDIKQADFTVGTWKVQVIATLNGQTATAGDTMEVGP